MTTDRGGSIKHCKDWEENVDENIIEKCEGYDWAHERVVAGFKPMDPIVPYTVMNCTAIILHVA